MSGVREVWWGSLNALGRNAAVAECFGLNPRENWAGDLSAIVGLCNVKKQAVTVQVDNGLVRAVVGYGRRAEETGWLDVSSPAEAVCVALLRWAGVVVHLGKKEEVDGSGGSAELGVQSAELGKGGV